MRSTYVDSKVKPLSVNKVWQGRRFKTPEYKVYERDLLLTLPKKEIIKGLVEVEINLFLKNANRTDIDNPIKPLLDIITKKGYIEDDRNIIKLVVTKEKRSEEGFIIKIKEV